MRVEAPVEADHQRRAGLGHDPQGRDDPFGRQVDGFFAEHRLAGARGPLDQVGVHVGGGADQHGADVGRGQDGVDRGGLGPALRRHGAGRRGIGVGHRDQRRVRPRRHVAAVDAPDPARADETHLQHAGSSRVPALS